MLDDKISEVVEVNQMKKKINANLVSTSNNNVNSEASNQSDVIVESPPNPRPSSHLGSGRTPSVNDNTDALQNNSEHKKGKHLY